MLYYSWASWARGSSGGAARWRVAGRGPSAGADERWPFPVPPHPPPHLLKTSGTPGYQKQGLRDQSLGQYDGLNGANPVCPKLTQPNS